MTTHGKDQSLERTVARAQMGGLATALDELGLSQGDAEILKSTIAKGASDGELAFYLRFCKTKGLDPFARQVHFVARRVQEDGQWKETFTMQTGIDGFRVIAERAAEVKKDLEGVEGPYWCGPAGSDGKPQWVDVWLDERSPPKAARFIVHRKGRRPYIATALFGEYAQRKSGGDLIAMWSKMPANQIAKCAEAAAWRRAYPEDLGSLYVEDEMHQADNPDRAGDAAGERTDGRVRPSRAEALKAKIVTSAGASAPVAAALGAVSATAPATVPVAQDSRKATTTEVAAPVDSRPLAATAQAAEPATPGASRDAPPATTTTTTPLTVINGGGEGSVDPSQAEAGDVVDAEYAESDPPPTAEEEVGQTRQSTIEPKPKTEAAPPTPSPAPASEPKPSTPSASTAAPASTASPSASTTSADAASAASTTASADSAPSAPAVPMANEAQAKRFADLMDQLNVPKGGTARLTVLRSAARKKVDKVSDLTFEEADRAILALYHEVQKKKKAAAPGA